MGCCARMPLLWVGFGLHDPHVSLDAVGSRGLCDPSNNCRITDSQTSSDFGLPVREIRRRLRDFGRLSQSQRTH